MIVTNREKHGRREGEASCYVLTLHQNFAGKRNENLATPESRQLDTIR
jgi:hypothetical protein